MNTRTPLPRLALALLATLGATSCRDDQDPGGASELLDRLRADDYRGWARAPGYPERRASAAPHGGEVDLFVNDVVEEALAGPGVDTWPVGSLIVKDGFDGGALSLVAAMEKRADGWYWAEWDAAGASLYSGKPGLCVNCHASGADYVRAFGLP